MKMKKVKAGWQVFWGSPRYNRDHCGGVWGSRDESPHGGQ